MRLLDLPFKHLYLENTSIVLGEDLEVLNTIKHEKDHSKENRIKHVLKNLFKV